MSEEWYNVCKTAINAKVEELQERTEEAERKSAAGEEFCRVLSRERDELLKERDELLETLRESAATLTRVDTQGMETNAILQTVRGEKEELEHRISGLEMDLAYMHARVQQMDDELGEYASSLESSKKSERELMAKVEEEQINGAALSDQLMRREEQILDMRRRIQSKDDTISSLNHSIDTKTRQLHVLIKERDRLRLEAEKASKKVLVHTKRPTTLPKSSPLASPVSQVDISVNTTLDTSQSSLSHVSTPSPVKQRGTTTPEAFSLRDDEALVVNRMKKSSNASCYSNMTLLLSAIEEACQPVLDEDQDPIAWLHEERPTEEMRLKMMKVIIKKQEEEICKLKAAGKTTASPSKVLKQAKSSATR